MAEFREHAASILSEAGLAPEAGPAAELLLILSERAREWADRAAAFGGQIDARTATCIAAKALIGDAEVRRRLAELGLDEVQFAARLTAASDGAPHPPEHTMLRRRRWGQEGQPAAALVSAPDEDAGSPGQARSFDPPPPEALIGLPVYGPGHERVGSIVQVMRESGSNRMIGVQLDDEPTDAPPL